MGNVGKKEGGGLGLKFTVKSKKPPEEEPTEEVEYEKLPSNDENDIEGDTYFDSPQGAVKWFKNPKMSNMEDWEKNQLTPEETHSVLYYVGNDYTHLNKSLYKTPWDDIGSNFKTIASDLYNAINKFELNKTIHTVRKCDFKIFGSNDDMTVEQVINFLNTQTDGGLIQTNGFLSTTTKSQGTYADSVGLKIKFTIPPNKGGGAFISDIAHNYGESEFLLNTNAVLRFDSKSVKLNELTGDIEVNAEWVGQAVDQAFGAGKVTKKKKKK